MKTQACGECPACNLKKDALRNNWPEVLVRVGGCFNPRILKK